MKYTGALAKPIVQKNRTFRLADLLNLKEFVDQPYKEMAAKIPELFAAHSVNEGDWQALAISLAREHVTGFNIVRPPGRKTEWSVSDKAELRYDVEEIIKAGLKKIPITDALRRVQKLERWSEKTKGMNVAALRKHYDAADISFLPIIAEARAYETIVGEN